MIVKNVPGRATWGHIALLAGFAAFIVWYVADSFLASSQITNLLLIVPVGGLALFIAAMLLVQTGMALRSNARGRPGAPEAPAEQAPWRHRYGPMASMIGMVIYVVGLPWAGFDLATACFVAANMWIYGERNLVMIAGYACAFGAAVAAAMRYLLFVPIPTLLPL